MLCLFNSFLITPFKEKERLKCIVNDKVYFLEKKYQISETIFIVDINLPNTNFTVLDISYFIDFANVTRLNGEIRNLKCLPNRYAKTLRILKLALISKQI